MKWLTLALAVLVIGCVVCEIEEEPEGVLEFKGSCGVQIKGEIGLTINDGTQSKPNEVTGDLMLGLASGLTIGDCWGGNTEGYLKATWEAGSGQGYPSRSLYWLESASEISYTGGNGSCDSVIYVSTTKQWPYGGTWWNLWEAWIYRPPLGTPTLSDNIVKQEPHGALGDSIVLGDYVQIDWEIQIGLIDASGEGNYATDTLAFDMAEGLRYDDMPYWLYADYYYNNADTSRRTLSYEIEYNGDTSIVQIHYTSQDTIRNTANDTLYGIDFINTNGEIVARDTVNRYMSMNKSAKMVETVYLTIWPTQ
jgi:hypothetical protein